LVAEFDSLEFTEEETDNIFLVNILTGGDEHIGPEEMEECIDWGAINKEADYYIP
jgi:hypothetical protein